MTGFEKQNGQRLLVAVLISTGRNPVSGVVRRAELDARALEIVLALDTDVQFEVIHAGDPENPVLKDYLGMGLSDITVLPCDPDDDPASSLVWYLNRIRPDVVLTGNRAETGEGSGFIPYAVAQQLGALFVAQITALKFLADSKLQLSQSIPGGYRRRLYAQPPIVGSVDGSALPPRIPAYARSQRGKIHIVEAPRQNDAQSADWNILTGRNKPKKITRYHGETMAERLDFAWGQDRTGGTTIEARKNPRNGADAIHRALGDAGLLDRAGKGDNSKLTDIT